MATLAGSQSKCLQNTCHVAGAAGGTAVNTVDKCDVPEPTVATTRGHSASRQSLSKPQRAVYVKATLIPRAKESENILQSLCYIIYMLNDDISDILSQLEYITKINFTSFYLLFFL